MNWKKLNNEEYKKLFDLVKENYKTKTEEELKELVENWYKENE